MNTFYANFLLRFSYVLLLTSCVHTDRATSNFKLLLNSACNSKTTKISFEGAYNEKNDEGYYLRSPLYFFENGLVFYDFGISVDSSDNNDRMHKYFQEKKEWGTYKIIADTIKACIYFKYLGGAASFILTYFQGIIKNKETILEWQVVEPYPKMDKYLRKEYAFLFMEKPDLYFKPLSIKSFMDSISKKAWILKYRDKK